MEQYLPKYGRNEVHEPRQCVFIGTTNKTAYLRDETGGRRFWPVRVGKIDTDALTRDRDQLFAEATAAFRDGAHWWPGRDFERNHIATEQEDRFEADAWEGAVSAYLVGRATTTTHDLASGALGLGASRLGTVETRRITATMERLGWIAKRNASQRWWQRGTPGG